MLMAEELALVAVKPDTGRHELGTGEQLNACLAGLLVAELLLDGAVGPGGRDDRIVAAPGRAAPQSPTLAAAAHDQLDRYRGAVHAEPAGTDLELIVADLRRQSLAIEGHGLRPRLAATPVTMPASSSCVRKAWSPCGRSPRRRGWALARLLSGSSTCGGRRDR